MKHLKRFIWFGVPALELFAAAYALATPLSGDPRSGAEPKSAVQLKSPEVNETLRSHLCGAGPGFYGNAADPIEVDTPPLAQCIVRGGR